MNRFYFDLKRRMLIESFFLQTLPMIGPIFLSLQHWTKYLEQSKERKPNWTGAENFDNCFCTTTLKTTQIWLSWAGGHKTPL